MTAPAKQIFDPWLILALSLTLLTSGLAVIVWGSQNDWQLLHLSIYQLFPIFGLVAFSIMWSQYMMEAVKKTVPGVSHLRRYYSTTSLLVLFAILLHPGLLIAQRFHDGYGLPPHSYETYVAPMLQWVTVLGSASLLMFLAFELHHFFKQKPWWRYVLVLNDIAMVAVFYHGLRLGQQLQSGWYQKVWYVYGVGLAVALIIKYVPGLQRREAAPAH